LLYPFLAWIAALILSFLTACLLPAIPVLLENKIDWMKSFNFAYLVHPSCYCGIFDDIILFHFLKS